MAHFARIENGIVVNVHVVNNINCLDENGKESEAVGIAFLKKVHGQNKEFVQTSYNGNIRKNYAGIGYTYDAQKNAFIAPKPEGEDWVFNEETCRWDFTGKLPDMPIAP